MYAKVMLPIAALVLSGCDRPPEACRLAIEAKLVAPSTVEYLSYSELSPSGNVATERRYSITVDAKNRMGVPLRSRWQCTLMTYAGTGRSVAEVEPID